MTGRRRDSRYGLDVPGEGSFSFVQDVIIERVDGKEVYAISDDPETAGAVLTLDSSGLHAGELRVRLEDCAPAVVDGVMRYRLRFVIL